MNLKTYTSCRIKDIIQGRQALRMEKTAFLLPLRFPEWMASPSQRSGKHYGIEGFSHILVFCFIFLLISLFPLFAHAQEIKNIRVTQAGNTVNVLYDLSGEGQIFKVDLFYSVDNGQTWKGPLKGISGDVGERVLPGINKRMTWNVLSEPGLEEGYLQFKVLAETTGLPGSIQTQTRKQKPVVNISRYKTGKTISLSLAVASAGTGVFAYLQGNKLYDEYKTATDNAAELRSKVETYDIIYLVAFALAGASTVSFIVYSAKHGKAKKELTFQPVPLQNGGGLAVSLKF
ncbi:MAG: hypothetical protein K0B11_21030 [Mariniphaga sp.]|nr:hypothetical protein [Mariniphaga sp.]